MAFTLAEARIFIEELAKNEDQIELRMAEAYHAPNALSERHKKIEAKGKTQTELWMAAMAKLDPEKYKDVVLKQQARDFIKAQSG